MKSIRSRLVAGLGLIIVFFLLQAALVWWGQDTVRRDVVDATRKNTIASSQLGELAVLAQQIRRYEKEYFVYVTNKDKRDGYIKEWETTASKTDKLLAAMRSNANKEFDDIEVGKIKNWAGAADFYGSEMRKIFSATNNQAALVSAASAAPVAASDTKPSASAGSAKPAAVAVPATAPIAMFTPIEVNVMIAAGKDRFSGELIKGVTEMLKDKTAQTLALADVAASGFAKMLYAVLLTVAVGILIAAGLMLTLPKSVTTPLAALTDSVDAISKGSLDTKVDSCGIVEFEGLAKALERLRIGQQALVARMRR
jgi:HAMP domain-containing protein